MTAHCRAWKRLQRRPAESAAAAEPTPAATPCVSPRCDCAQVNCADVIAPPADKPDHPRKNAQSQADAPRNRGIAQPQTARRPCRQGQQRAAGTGSGRGLRPMAVVGRRWPAQANRNVIARLREADRRLVREVVNCETINCCPNCRQENSIKGCRSHQVHVQVGPTW